MKFLAYYLKHGNCYHHYPYNNLKRSKAILKMHRSYKDTVRESDIVNLMHIVSIFVLQQRQNE